MTPVAAAKQRRKFDSQTFLSTIDGGPNYRSLSQKATDLYSGRLVRCCFLYTGRKGKTRRCVADREGSHNKHSERGRFLRRGLPCRAASTPVFRNCNDRLLRDANR